ITGRVWLPAYLQSHDFALTAGPPAETVLAARAGVGESAAVPQTVLLLDVHRALPLRFSGRSAATGIVASPESAGRIEDYLRRKGLRSSLNGPGFVTLFDASSLQWSQEGCLRVCLLNLRHAPDLAWQSHLMDILRGGCAAPTSEILKLADALTDESLFASPDRQSRVTAGPVSAHLGASARARCA